MQHEETFIVLDIEVDIGHGDAFRVEEAFEDEFEIERVDRSDFKRVSDDRACAGAANVIPDILFPCEPDQVVNDQEV